MYICVCKGITDTTIRDAVSRGISFKALKRELGLSTQCGSCVSDAVAIIEQELQQSQLVRPVMANGGSISIRQVA